MLSMGFIDQVEDILSRLPKQRQNLFFSATMPEEMQGLIKRKTIQWLSKWHQKKQILSSTWRYKQIIKKKR
ncbi:Probable ATP-dependent RNA helicase exp9 [Listeria monocytogenes N53-1]|nr:Probable ATP-dependent RNA helicase exp9 [Listeria monocytogenes N53-1]